jgi:hypothetical protein
MLMVKNREWMGLLANSESSLRCGTRGGRASRPERGRLHLAFDNVACRDAPGETSAVVLPPFYGLRTRENVKRSRL